MYDFCKLPLEQSISNVSMPNTGPFAKLSKLVPHVLHPMMVTL